MPYIVRRFGKDAEIVQEISVRYMGLEISEVMLAFSDSAQIMPR